MEELTSIKLSVPTYFLAQIFHTLPWTRHADAKHQQQWTSWCARQLVSPPSNGHTHFVIFIFRIGLLVLSLGHNTYVMFWTHCVLFISQQCHLMSPTQYTFWPSYPPADIVNHCIIDNIYRFARPASIYSHTVVMPDTNTRQALQKFVTNPTLLSNIESWVQGGHFCRHASTPSFPTRPLSNFQIARFLPNFESPIITLKVAGQTALSCVDSGASGVLCSMGYYKMLFPGIRPQQYVGLSYKQASGDFLPIEGQFEAHIEIGHLKVLTTLVIMKSPDSHRELLLGWKLLKSNNISICPDGLFCFPQETFLPQQEPQHVCQPIMGPEIVHRTFMGGISPLVPPLTAGEGEGAKNVAPTFLTFPVHLLQSYTIPPLGKALVLCKLKKLTQDSLRHLKGRFMCFSSENIEKYTPLLDISVYFQIVPHTELFHNVTLLYRNQTKQTVFLFEDQYIADCVEMQQAASADLISLAQTQPDVYMACRILNQNEPSLQEPAHSQFEFQIEEDQTPVSFSNVKTHDATPAQRQKLISMLKKFPALFSSHTWSVGAFDSTVYLRAKTGAVPQQQRFIPHPKKLERQCQTIIRKLLSIGLLVENPDSPWRSNILFLLKPEKKGTFHQPHRDKKSGDQDPARVQGKLPDRGPGPFPQTLQNQDNEIPLSRIRICLDMTMINSHLKRTWPSCVLPKIEDIFNNCYGMTVLSRYDLTQSFWSKKVNKSMMDLSTFYFMGKAYSMTRMAQGLTCSSEIFQTSINKVIQKNRLSLEQNITFCGQTSCSSPTKPCSNKACGKPAFGCFAFIDDIFIVSRTVEDHYIILERSLSAFHGAHLKVKLEKTDLFIRTSCDILGFHLDLANGCISPAQKNLQKVMSLPPPHNFKKLQRWIGAVTFYCHLLPDFSNLLHPLTNLLKTDRPWCWGPEEQQAYDLVLRKMAASPTLFILNPDAPIFAVTDGCLKKSISYCQLQWRQDLDTWCPLRFQSHKLSAHMINYSQAQVEGLSLCTYASENYPLLMSHTSHCFSDAKSLSFISRFRYHNLTIWRYHLLLSSLPIVFHWLSCQTPLLILCDLFTREKEYQMNPLDKFKEVLNKRISPKDIENLQFIDFSHMPSMKYEEVMNILDVFYKILEKNTPQQVTEKFKTHMAQVIFPNLPNITFQLTENVFNIYSDLFNNNIGKLQFCQYYPRPSTPNLPGIGFLAKSQDPELSDTQHFTQHFTTFMHHKKGPEFSDVPDYSEIAAATERLCLFFPSSTEANLIREQEKDIALLRLLQNHPKVFVRIHGVICHKKVLHSCPVTTICWPTHLNLTLLQRAHKVNDFYHIKKPKLKGELFQLFHIRGFDEAYKKLNCKHCDLNTRQHKLALPLGIPFMISQPRTFLSLDIMYINTAWTKCAFLTIVDVTNHFVQAVPVTKNATATDIYNIFYTRWVSFAGFAVGICTDNSRNFNCKLAADLAAMCNFVHFKITPLNSKSNRAEAAQKFLLSILQAMDQSHHLNEGNFEQMLCFSCLLWNSTFSPALRMSPAEHFYFSKIRTNSFVTFSSLLHHQHRHTLSQNVSAILDLLNIIRLKKREHFLKQKNVWENYKDKFIVGGFCFLQQDRVKKAGWKLRRIFQNSLFKITKVFKTYLFVIPVKGTLSLIKSPYIQGDQIEVKHRRVHKSNVKICDDPLSFLNLQNCKHHIDAAAKLLGTGLPVQRIAICANPSLQSTLPSQRIFDSNFWEVAYALPGDVVYQDGGHVDKVEGEVIPLHPLPSHPPPLPPTRLCATFTARSLLDALQYKNDFVSFQSANSWVLLDRKLRDSPVWSSQNTHATCSHGLTEKYKNYQKKLLNDKLRQDVSRRSGTSPSGSLTATHSHFCKKKTENFRGNMDKYLLTFDRASLPKRCIEKIKGVFIRDDGSSSDSEDWNPPKPSSLVVSSQSSTPSHRRSRQSLSLHGSGSSTGGTRSSSLHSALDHGSDGVSHHDDNTDDEDTGVVPAAQPNSTPQRLLTPYKFVSDQDIDQLGAHMKDQLSKPQSTPKVKSSKKGGRPSGMISIQQALTPPPPPLPTAPPAPVPADHNHPVTLSATSRRRSLRVKTRKGAHSTS